MWSPTHVQVTVQKAWGLLTKGSNNTNDCFVTIVLGKVKYQTSVKLKSGTSVEWHEECELPIPDQGNTAEIVLTVLHRNFLGVDEFLGRVNIPLAEFDVYERPRNRWYSLQSKVGKENKKERGELEVRIAFIVKAGSLTDLSKKDKHKSSIGQLSHVAQSVGGSLLSLGTLEKRKGLKKFAKSIGSKMNLKHKKKDKESECDSMGSVSSLSRRKGTFGNQLKSSKQSAGDADPGVVSDEDEFTFDDLSHNSSTSELNSSQSEQPAPRKPADEWEQKLYGRSGSGSLANRTSWEPSKIPQIQEEPNINTSEKPLAKDNLHGHTKLEINERIIIGGENEKRNSNNRLLNEVLQKFNGKSREDLIMIVCELQNDLDVHKRKLKDLEDYLDDLLLRVMETTPRILQNPYIDCKMTHAEFRSYSK